MKTSIATATATTFLILLASVAKADFDIYYGKEGIYSQGYTIFDEEVTRDDCNIINDLRMDEGGDASNDHPSGRGVVRCEGEGCGYDGNPEDIEQLEMNFGKYARYHFTLYKDRDWTLWDKKNKKVGTCVPAEGFPRHTVDCGEPDEDKDCHDICHRGAKTKKKFFCRSDLDVEEIKRDKDPSSFKKWFNDLFD